MNYVSYVSTFVISIAVVLLVAALSIGIKTLPVKPPVAAVAKKEPTKRKVVHRRRRAPLIEQAGAGIAPRVKRDTASDHRNTGLLKFHELPSAEDQLLPPPDGGGILPGAPGTTRPQGDLESGPGYQAPPDDSF